MRAIIKTSIALAAILAAAPVAAQTTTLSTGSADGQVTVAVNGAGGIARDQATYNPVGAGAAATTIFNSSLYYRIGNSGARNILGGSSGLAGNGTTATSIFAVSGLTGTLSQSVSNTFQSGVQSGSLLTQTYNFVNTSAAAISLDLVRYLDGDLNFDGSLIDGGGRLAGPGGSTLLFELDSATGASTGTTFVGIYSQGGTANGYQISQYNISPTTDVFAGAALNNGISGDGNSNGFIDAGAGYDVTLLLGNVLNIAAGGTGTYVTYTLFGSGAPDAVVIPGDPTAAVPEPASWAMMMLGIGMVGGSLRRRCRSVHTLAAA